LAGFRKSREEARKAREDEQKNREQEQAAFVTKVAGQLRALDPRQGEASQLYASRVSVWLHQDQLMWSRVVWGMTVEGAALGGSLARPGLPGAVILLLGTVVLGLFWLIREKDRADQAQCYAIIDAYHEMCGVESKARRMISEAGPKRPRANAVLAILTALVMTLNVLLAVLHLVAAFSGRPEVWV